MDIMNIPMPEKIGMKYITKQVVNETLFSVRILVSVVMLHFLTVRYLVSVV